MALRRQFAPREINAADLRIGRIDPHYEKILLRLLAAHALAEKLTAFGYERALRTCDDASLKETIQKNLIEETRHARLVYRALAELGVSEKAADRTMLPLMKGPSFEAPRFFAEKASGEMDLLMATLALDMTGLMMIGVNYQDSSYAPHSRAAELIMEEEADHEVFASELLGVGVEKFGRKEVNAALRNWLPRAVNFFGPPGSGFTYDCIRYGLKARDNQELADLYVTVLERRADQLGLEMPRLTPGYPHAVM
ncbi:MAG TPA: Phenylacetic acid catabolic protein [Candidatus Binataceae bacterium]|nr:Phenylacetic acid catabolic protein [Candidatus Binataceae bacterium]